MDSVQAEITKKKHELETKFSKEAEELGAEVVKLKTVKSALQNDIITINKQKVIAEEELELVQVEKTQAEADTRQLKLQSSELNTELLNLQTEMDATKSTTESLESQIILLEGSRQQINEDIDILQTEASSLENQIIELDATHKVRKDTYDKQLSDIQIKLKNATDSLTEAQNKDKQVRESWVAGHEALDKREKVVRNMEARLAGAESRIEELDRFGVL